MYKCYTLKEPCNKSNLKPGRLLVFVVLMISLFSYQKSFAQIRNITGKVIDSISGTSLKGVTIKVVGSATMTVTDAGGNFALSVSETARALTLNYVGYQAKRITLGSGNVYNASLSSAVAELDDVVITGFGLKSKRETLSGAISTVSASELSNSKASTASAALVGKAPGINFRQTTGQPGADAIIQIRNYGTPLVVIDGATRDYGSFSQMDFNDIESISILKDASASIYGMQAANGVLVVTTKKGKRNQKTTIGFQSYYGVQQPGGYNKPADAATYLKAIIQDETYNNVPNASRTITRDEYQKWVNQTDEAHTSFDWYKYIWRTSPQIYNSINLSGGSESTDYYVSVGNLIQKGSLRNFDGFQRTNFESRINTSIGTKLRLGFNVSGRLEHNDNPGLPGDDYSFALTSAFKNLPTKRPFANGNEAYPAVSSIDPQFSYGWIDYPTSGKFQTENRVIQLNGTAEYDIVKGLKARALFTYWFKNTKNDLQEKSPILYAYDGSTNQYNVAYQGTGRYIERTMANSEELTSNVQLDYENRFGKHHIHAVGGLEARSGNYPSIYILGSQEANGIPNLNIKSLTSMTDNVSFVQRRLGFLGRVNYDYDSKYIAEFSGRYDGSFFYKSGKRFGFFPSGSVAYRISQEEFWKNNSFLSKTINDFKIRGSYGVLGQELGSALSYITGYNFNQGSSILDGSDVVSSRVTGLATDNITWGRVYVFDVGFDAGFLRNRLTTSFSWFDRNSTGQLASRYDVLLPNEVGFGLPAENLNSDRTRGLEFSAQWTDKLQNGLSYSFGGNFTFSRWITGVRYKPHWSSSWDQYRDLGNIEGRYRDGSFQLVAVGQFQSWEQIANHKIDQDHVGNITIRPGDYIYQDVNNDGAINDLDMQNVTYRVNNGTPFINFAFNFSTAYKNFDFRADFAGASCFTYEQQGYMRYFDGSGNVSQYLADNSSWYNDIWDKNSGISVGRYPLLTKGINNWMNTHWPNNFWQTNVTYVKLRNIELGYSLPKQWMQKAGIANLRIYVAAQNLLTISNMPGNLDPEITSNQGISYPNLRMFNAGFQIKL